MERIDVIPGVSVVDIPEADLAVLCGCPADVVKHLMRRGLILRKDTGGVAYEIQIAARNQRGAGVWSRVLQATPRA